MKSLLSILILHFLCFSITFGQKNVQQDFQFAEEELKPSSQIKSFQKINDLEGIDNHGKSKHPAYKSFLLAWEKKKPDLLTPNFIDSLIRANSNFVEFEETFWAQEEKNNIEELSVINQQILLAKKMTTLGKLIFAGIVIKQLSYNKITRSNKAVVTAASLGDPLFFSEMLIFMKLIPMKYRHVHNDKLFIKLIKSGSISRIIEYAIVTNEKENRFLYSQIKDSYALELAEKNHFLDEYIEGLKELSSSSKKKDILRMLSSTYKPYERDLTKFSLLQERKSVNYKLKRIQFVDFLKVVHKYPKEYAILKKDRIFKICLDYHMEQLLEGYRKNKVIYNDIKSLKLFEKLCKDPYAEINDFITSINKHKGTFDIVSNDKIFINGLEIQTLEESLKAVENYFVTYKRIKNDERFIKEAKLKKLEPLLSQAEMKNEVKDNKTVKSQTNN